MNDILVDLIDDYVERRKESLELLAIPGLADQVRASSREFRKGKTTPLKDVRKKRRERLIKNIRSSAL